jgi:hypothetical protein
MGQILLVAVDAHYVFQRASDTGFPVTLELGKVEDDIGLHHLAGDEVLMPAEGVSAVQEIGVVHRDPKLVGVVGNFLEQTILPEIKQDEVLKGVAVFKPDLAQMVAEEDGSAEIAEVEVHSARAEALDDRIETASLTQAVEIAGLDGSVAQSDGGGTG